MGELLNQLVNQFEFIIIASKYEHIASTRSEPVSEILQGSRGRVKTWIFVVRSAYVGLLQIVNRHDHKQVLDDKIFDDGCDTQPTVETITDSLKYSMVRRALVNLEFYTKELQSKLYNSGMYTIKGTE